MKRTFLAAILATAAIAFSCTMEEPAQSSSVVMNPTATIENFVMDGPLTKLTFKLNDNVASYAFADEDVLRAYPVAPEIGPAVRFTVKEKKDTKCVFTGAGFGLVEGQKYAAYYPGGSNEVPAVDEVPVSFLGQSQPAANEWNLSNADFLYATGIEAENRACNFTMKHLGALLVMDVTFTEAGTYKELALKSTVNFVTEGTVDLTDDEIALEPETTSDTITLALGGDNGMAVTANQTVRFYMMVAPVDMSNATLTLTLTDVNNNTIVKEGPGSKFEAGKAAVFGATPAAPVVPAVNLSAEETANTYIVDVDNIVPAGYYFSTMKAGNGVHMGSDFDYMGYNGARWPSNGNADLIAASAATVLWNQNNCITDVTYDSSDRTIHFKATGNKGCAKVCAYVNGINFWTWLIWCTDQPGTIEFTNELNNKTFTVMDRNIGATTNIGSSDYDALSGIYYQWGNPVPYSKADWAAGSYTNGNRSIQDVLWNPNTISVPNAWAVQWFDPAGPSNAPTTYAKQLYGILWGGGCKGAADNGLAEKYHIRHGNTSTKTLYDPCPPGYKVAPYDFLDGYAKVSQRSNASAIEYGVVLSGDNGGEVLLPYNGMGWVGGDGIMSWAQQGVYVCIWLSAYNNTNMGYAIRASKNSVDEINVDGNNIVIDDNGGRGFGVRCVAE